MARKLTQDFKFAARTAPELYEAVNGFVLRLASRGGVKFRGRKLGLEAALNAVLLDFMEKPEPERAAILSRNVPRFEEMLLSDTPAQIGATFPPHVNETKVFPTTPPDSPTKKQRRGAV